MRAKCILAFGLAAVLACGLAHADTVILRNGNEINGTVTEDNSTTVVIKRPNGTVQSFRKADVDEVVYARKKAPPPEPEKVEPKKEEPVTAEAPAEPKLTAPETADAKPVPEVTPATDANPRDDEQPAVVIGDAKPTPATEPGEPGEKPVEPKEPGDGDRVYAEKTEAEKREEAVKAAEAKAPLLKLIPELKPAEKSAIAKPESPKTAGKDVKDDKEVKDDKAAKDDKKAKDGTETAKADAEPKAEAWSPPPGLAGFPLNAKRMNVENEKKFLKAMADLASGDEAKRLAAKSEIQGLGPEVLPYLVAGIQHTNVDARSICMTLIGQLNGRTAVKHVIEVFYAAMPDTGEAPTWQVPFIRAIKATLPAITGKSFITVEPSNAMVQKGLTQYLEWYKGNYDRLPPQMGEAEIDPTDPDYTIKLEEARALKLGKRSWPAPPSPSELVAGPNKNNDRKTITAKDVERPADRERNKSTVPTLSREDALKRR